MGIGEGVSASASELNYCGFHCYYHHPIAG